MSLTFYSPAKVNLFFKVISKRNDGYHDIASLYRAISLADLLRIKKAKKDQFFCFNDIDLNWDENNLIYKALSLFRKKTHIFEPVSIYLKKNIPLQAGLGGGSSNAATMLWALNQLFDKPLLTEDLIDISKSIGADVAFFFSSGTAFCSGIGNLFETIHLNKKMQFYIAKPNFGMCTKMVYENLDLNQLEKRDLKDIKQELIDGNISHYNDLEVSAFKIDPRLQKIKLQLLKRGFHKVVMTGSGSSFMCMGDVKPNKSKKIKFFSVFNVQRNLKSWYSF